MADLSTRPFWFDKAGDGRGFSTAGMAIAMLVTLSLVFTGAQVYRVQSAAADTQEVADAAALAADNVVAEYYLVARICDAVVLSLTVTGIVVMGLGKAALCTPVSAGVGAKLLRVGLNSFGESGTPEELYRHFGLDGAGIEKSVRKFLGK